MSVESEKKTFNDWPEIDSDWAATAAVARAFMLIETEQSYSNTLVHIVLNHTAFGPSPWWQWDGKLGQD